MDIKSLTENLQKEESPRNYEVSEEEFARVVTAIREHVVPIQTESPS
jgi:hypothetical protein